MDIRWTDKAAGDVTRLHDFLAFHNPAVAARNVQALIAAPERLIAFPRIGESLAQYDHREVRRLLIGDYEVRYEIAGDSIYILRIWHSREQRQDD
ncbi:type II toxin-antitoxin system RelE/ParE family toxin [Gluconacetobacter aggeris]|uniref:Type II toxin-antitoxin system RelE/ParE family toxin n=1 Tax=Gluconacetobacter aggeris TaxID=1286186 RepID=A0A7W4NUR7_9PROT|nr:type II toxin-antitoxin system RelE/ParE family toxin [Gluconacetobacter aggeris]MBB2166874.1 type II toxin-antitoxin system RelE/ParE family toxin [Gluconacetobacter aggeris]